ncbi:MAG: hypothetical protein J0I48_10570 [Devosia sp.]|uniref:hypothetical protein n=1 Tax=Devosia sp. 66-22 TaxID=1895753 RepID=UPI0009271619|nr:hypothetical protein [Devosia sp. 66-22]MBN9346624.1 hypothetical protein [Devosia sp.]OJX54718.1 MAG: hypothetical protein BGO81_16495 [Devosia sp. 66-22]
MSQENGAVIALTTLALWFAFIAFILVGYWMNVADLVTGNGGDQGLFVARIVGLVFAPLGAVLGVFF